MPRKTSRQMIPDCSERIAEALSPIWSLCFINTEVQHCILVQVFLQEPLYQWCKCHFLFVSQPEASPWNLSMFSAMTEWKATINICVETLDFVCLFWYGLNSFTYSHTPICRSKSEGEVYLQLPQPQKKTPYAIHPKGASNNTHASWNLHR